MIRLGTPDDIDASSVPSSPSPSSPSSKKSPPNSLPSPSNISPISSSEVWTFPFPHYSCSLSSPPSLPFPSIHILITSSFHCIFVLRSDSNSVFNCTLCTLVLCVQFYTLLTLLSDISKWRAFQHQLAYSVLSVECCNAINSIQIFIFVISYIIELI